jgi:hypothetical protein
MMFHLALRVTLQEWLHGWTCLKRVSACKGYDWNLAVKEPYKVALERKLLIPLVVTQIASLLQVYTISFWRFGYEGRCTFIVSGNNYVSPLNHWKRWGDAWVGVVGLGGWATWESNLRYGCRNHHDTTSPDKKQGQTSRADGVLISTNSNEWQA